MKKVLFLTLVLLGANTAIANSKNQNFEAALQEVQHSWAITNYAEKDLKKAEFPKLVDNAAQLVEDYPDKAEALIWLGIVKSSYAGVKGGMGALSVLKEAKKSLEQAIEIDEQALQGSAYTSLGVLYYKVPGWPISFGDDDDAEENLKKAQTINPDGIDVNFFLAEFYFENKDYDNAIKHLKLAQSAPKRPNRPLADKYRQEEVNQLLVQVHAKAKKRN